jgi:hypothetical protein
MDDIGTGTGTHIWKAYVPVPVWNLVDTKVAIQHFKQVTGTGFRKNIKLFLYKYS